MTRTLFFSIMALLTLIVGGPTAPTIAADIHWPGWLGPKRDGWVAGFEPPAPWPDKLHQTWRVEVGTGYGSPLVAQDRVYQHARQGNDEVVWCLDLQTGAVRWRQAYATPFKMGGGGERHGKGPKSSPALSGGKLFTMSITGRLSAWQADSGQLLWHHDFASRFKKTHPYWGASTSPLADRDRVFVHFGTDGDGALLALDAETGVEIWSHGSDGPAYSSPISVELDGKQQLVEWNERALLGVDYDTGQRLWEYSYPQVSTDQNMPTPVFHQGLILLGGENRGIRGLKPQHKDGFWQIEEQWFQKDVALDMSSAVVNGDLLFGFSHYGSGRIFCLDIATGQILWRGPGRTGENVTFLSVPGHVVALVNDGRLQVIAAHGKRFEQVASYRVAAGRTWAPPVLLPQAILVKDHNALTRWEIKPR